MSKRGTSLLQKELKLSESTFLVMLYSKVSFDIGPKFASMHWESNSSENICIVSLKEIIVTAVVVPVFKSENFSNHEKKTYSLLYFNSFCGIDALSRSHHFRIVLI